jgi:hypothetical protein
MLELNPRRMLWDLETPKDSTLRRTGIRWKTHGFHRRRYLRFDGNIGRGRGVVKRVESGSYTVRANGKRLRIQLVGQKWKGAFEIQSESPRRHRWTAVTTKRTP